MAFIEGRALLIAPGLIGIGDQAELRAPGPDACTFRGHSNDLDELLAQLGVVERGTFVVHDWGSALGISWANCHRDAIKGIASTEAFVQPTSWAGWTHAKEISQALRSPAGEDIVLSHNTFVEGRLPCGVRRKLTDEEIANNRRPESGETRRPTLTAPADAGGWRAGQRQPDPFEFRDLLIFAAGAQTVHQRRSHGHPQRAQAGMPDLAQPGRGHRRWHPFRRGALTGRACTRVGRLGKHPRSGRRGAVMWRPSIDSRASARPTCRGARR
jgi:hypothetical protein